MLLILSQWLSQDLHLHGFNVFTYITLRAVLAAMTALLISFVAGPPLIRWLPAIPLAFDESQRLAAALSA